MDRAFRALMKYQAARPPLIIRIRFDYLAIKDGVTNFIRCDNAIWPGHLFNCMRQIEQLPARGKDHLVHHGMFL